MLSKLQAESPSSPKIDLIFLDTLFHFNETYDLVERVKARYPNVTVHTFKPYGVETAPEFDALYGEKLYELSSELYDWSAKVEPMQRAFEELKVAAVLTGRRRSQGGARDKIPVIELDEERGVVKVNPLVRWSFDQVRTYIRENNVPYNALLDRGYKSIGDWHSTSPVGEGEDERAGRWKGQQKTECGIHNQKSRYAQYLKEQERKEQQEKLAAASVALEMIAEEKESPPESEIAFEPPVAEPVTDSDPVVEMPVVEQPIGQSSATEAQTVFEEEPQAMEQPLEEPLAPAQHTVELV